MLEGYDYLVFNSFLFSLMKKETKNYSDCHFALGFGESSISRFHIISREDAKTQIEVVNVLWD